MNKWKVNELFQKLNEIDWENNLGEINFKMCDLSIPITKPDPVGVVLQYWVEAFLKKQNVIFSSNKNTQTFPDFMLDKDEEEWLKIKAFNYQNNPAFDVANFDSYLNCLKNNKNILKVNYLIFGYEMNQNGSIKIRKIYLKKIWEICGISKKYPLKVQVKRGKIYNIRPSSNFKKNKQSDFKNEQDFLKAIEWLSNYQ